MLETLFVVGLLGALLAFILEFLGSLEAFPAICAGAVLVPLLVVSGYLRLLRIYDLQVLRRDPLPPDRFYWSIRGPALRLRTLGLIPISVLAWACAIGFPAALRWDRSSVIGWGASALAIAATAQMLAGTMAYFRGAQWLDLMSPAIIGWYRRTMYWLSEDAEFLGRGQLKEPNEKERAVY